jgi:uncharacterized membrane protein YeiH
MVIVTASTFQVPIEICATLAFALSGLIAGARKKLDAFGVFVVTGVAAFGAVPCAMYCWIDVHSFG